jgi:hypothetical protein
VDRDAFQDIVESDSDRIVGEDGKTMKLKQQDPG